MRTQLRQHPVTRKLRSTRDSPHLTTCYLQCDKLIASFHYSSDPQHFQYIQPTAHSASIHPPNSCCTQRRSPAEPMNLRKPIRASKHTNRILTTRKYHYQVMNNHSSITHWLLVYNVLCVICLCDLPRLHSTPGQRGNRDMREATRILRNWFQLIGSRKSSGY